MPNTYKMSTYLETQILNAIFRGQNYISPPTVYVALYTTNPTDEDIGIEITGSGYERISATFSIPSKEGSEKTLIFNSAELDFGIAEGNWGTITHVGVRDALTGGNLLVYGEVTNPKTILTNDRPIYYVGDLRILLG